MSYQITVKALSGAHLGQRITVTTDHTKATGVLQGFEHDGSIMTNLTYGGTEYVPGATTTHLTIFPNQRILADIGDEVEVHGDEAPEAPPAPTPASAAAGGVIPKIETTGTPWKVSDTAQYVGIVDGKHVYMTPRTPNGWV